LEKLEAQLIQVVPFAEQVTQFWIGQFPAQILLEAL
jgi:hypothetical protein